MALRSRGYNERQIDKAREGSDYGCTASLIQKRIDKAAQESTGQKMPWYACCGATLPWSAGIVARC